MQRPNHEFRTPVHRPQHRPRCPRATGRRPPDRRALFAGAGERALAHPPGLQSLHLQRARLLELRQPALVARHRNASLSSRIRHRAVGVRRQPVRIRHTAQNLRAPDSLLALPAQAGGSTRRALSRGRARAGGLDGGNLGPVRQAEVLRLSRAAGRRLALAVNLRGWRLRRVSPYAREISLHAQPGFRLRRRLLLRGRPLLFL